MTTITSLPAAKTLSGSELVPADQGNTTVRIPISQISVVTPQSPAEAAAGIVPTNASYPVGNVLRYGADSTGVLDSTAAIQAAVTAVANANGGTVLLPAGNFKIGGNGSGITITSSNVQLLGAGSTYQAYAGSDNPATRLFWGGGSSASAAMISVATPANAVANAISGVVVSGMKLDCGGLCGYGISCTSLKNCNFSQIYVFNPITAAFFLTTLPHGQLQEETTQHNIFTQCQYRCFDGVAAKKAHGFWLTSANPVATPPQGNSSFNTFIQCVGLTDGTTGNSSGVGYKLDDADNNHFIDCINYRATGTSVPSALLSGYRASCDGNVFTHFSDTTVVNAVQILGNATLGTGYNPTQNAFIMADANNGIAFPTMDAGCRVFWHTTNGTIQLPVALGMVIGQTGQDSTALGQVTNVGARSLLLINTSNAHAVLSDGTNIWGLNIDGSGNFRITHPAGSGGFQIGASLLGFFGATPVAEVSGYGTPTGGSHQSSFAAGSITLPNLAAAVAQLIIDLKSYGLIGA